MGMATNGDLTCASGGVLSSELTTQFLLDSECGVVVASEVLARVCWIVSVGWL